MNDELANLPADLSDDMKRVYIRTVKTLSRLNLTELQLQAVMNVVTDAALTAVDETIRRMVEQRTEERITRVEDGCEYPDLASPNGPEGDPVVLRKTVAVSEGRRGDNNGSDTNPAAPGVLSDARHPSPTSTDQNEQDAR